MKGLNKQTNKKKLYIADHLLLDEKKKKVIYSKSFASLNNKMKKKAICRRSFASSNNRMKKNMLCIADHLLLSTIR